MKTKNYNKTARLKSNWRAKWGAFLCLLLLMGTANATNYISNPGFEQGSIPTDYGQVANATGWTTGCAGTWFDPPGSYAIGSPDLFDSQSPNCLYDIPSNKWNINRPVRAGGRRYVGFSGGINQQNANGGYNYGESVMGTLTASLQADCNYKIGLWGSSIQGQVGASGCAPTSTIYNSPGNKIEVILRKTDCSGPEKLIFTSGSLPVGWTYYGGTFSLTAAEAAIGYDKVEFRMELQTLGGSKIVLLDDVSISDPDPAEAHLNGPIQICLGDPLLVDGTFSENETAYQWSITESNAAGTTTWDPSTTWIGPWNAGTANVDDVSALSGFNFQPGTYYLIRLAVGNCTTLWTADHQLVYVAPVPVISAGPDQTICAGTTVTIGSIQSTANMYTWTGPGFITQTNDGSAQVSPTSTSTYALNASNHYGCTAADEVVVTVHDPIGRVKIRETEGGEPCDANYTLTATTIPNATYLWSTGATTTSIFVAPTTNTTYSVTITNACGSTVANYTLSPVSNFAGSFPAIGHPASFDCGELFQFTDLTLPLNAAGAYNAYEYQIQVHDAWGTLIYDYTENAAGTGFDNGEISWNGLANISTNYTAAQIANGYVNSHNGECVPGEYTISLRLKNCDTDSWVVLNAPVSIINGRHAGGNGAATHKTESGTDVQMELFPNPSKGNVTLHLDLAGEKHIQVVDLQGKIVYETVVSTHQSELQLAGQTAGLYFIKVACSGQTFMQKLILQ